MGVFVAVGITVFVAFAVGTDGWVTVAIGVFTLVCVGKETDVALGICVAEPTIEPPPKSSKITLLALELPHAKRPTYPPLA